MNKKIYRLMSIVVAFVLTFAGYYQARASTVTAPLMSASVYYVSTTGNDTNTCTQSAPCKTIKRGMSVAQSGDTVIVSAGVYREYVYVDKSITIISNGATIDGVNATGSVIDGLISVVASNVKLQGFTISNAKNYGLANFGNNNQFVNNVIHHTQGAGIWMRDGKFNTFEGNELYDTVLQNSVGFDGIYYTCNPNAGSWPSAINSWGAAGFNVWRGNNIHDNCGEGMVVYTGDLVENNTFKNNWSVEIYIIADKTIVRNNTIIDTKPYTPRGSDESWRNVPAGIAIGDETVCLTDNNTITGNNITGARYGVSFYGYIPCSGIKNSLIENNTIINAWEYGLRILTGAHTNSIIRNNRVQLASGKLLTIQNSGFIMTGNIFFSNVNMIEWNGKSYDFAGWNNVIPGNYWGTAGTVTNTNTPTPTATLSMPIPTLILPTITVLPSLTATQLPTASPSPIIPTLTSTTAPTALPQPTNIIVVSPGTNSVDVRVSSGNDDVEESSSGAMYIDSSDLELIYDDNTQVVGIRFTGVKIPKGAVITNAYIQFKVDETSRTKIKLTINGEATANASAFAKTARNISIRQRTTNSAIWSPLAWSKTGEMGKSQRTPSLAPIIQEIISQTDWIAGNSLVLIISGSGKRTAEAYEGDAAGAPLLHIEYTTGSTLSMQLPQTVPTATPTTSPMATLPIVTQTPVSVETLQPSSPTPLLLPSLTPTSLAPVFTPTAEPVVNKNPVITSNGSPSIVENSVSVTTVTATDADLPAQVLSYSISGGADSALFNINSVTGELTFIAAPDYETPIDTGLDNVYNVTVQVSDGTLIATQNIAVTVRGIDQPQ